MAYGANIDQRKTNKRNHIIDLFRTHGYLSKVKAKKLSGYSMDTVLSIFNSLLDEELIFETEGEQKQKGRRATFYQLKSKAHTYLGITFNQSGFYSSLISFSDEIIDTEITEIDITSSKDIFLKEFEKHIISFRERNKQYFSSLRSIGIAVPGAIDTNSGTLINYTLMPELNNFNIRDYISNFFPGKEVFIEHNIKSMTSYFFSHSDIISNYNKILYISVRSGIASGVISNGQIVTDHGELGHIKVGETSERCICGRKGCLDMFFSYKSVADAVKPHINCSKLRPLAQDIIDAYKSGNPEVVKIIRDRFRYFAEAVYDAVNVIAPDLIIVSGKILGCFEDPVKELITLSTDICEDTGYVRNFSNSIMKYMDLGAEIAAQGSCYYLIRKDWGYEEL